MAPKKSTSPGRTARFYRDNPEAYRKKLAAQKVINRKPKQRKYRSELVQARRAAGIYGKGGKDMSHTTEGTLVREDYKKNRARNGHGDNGRLKM
jgi:hypothetical protein